jgi:hypothetical protein
MSRPTKKQVSRAIERDADFRTLKMCVKYLDKVCSPRMRKPTLEFLWNRFVKP